MNGPSKNSAAGTRRGSAGTVDLHLAVGGQQEGGQFRGRVGVGQRSAQRAPGADLRVGDEGQRAHQQRMGGADLGIPFQDGVWHGRARPGAPARRARRTGARRSG